MPLRMCLRTSARMMVAVLRRAVAALPERVAVAELVAVTRAVPRNRAKGRVEIHP